MRGRHSADTAQEDSKVVVVRSQSATSLFRVNWASNLIDAANRKTPSLGGGRTYPALRQVVVLLNVVP